MTSPCGLPARGTPEGGAAEASLDTLAQRSADAGLPPTAWDADAHFGLWAAWLLQVDEDPAPPGPGAGGADSA